MTAAGLGSPMRSTSPSPRAARAILIALHVPYVIGPIVFVAVNLTGTAGYRLIWVFALCAVLPAGLLQLRHSLAVAAGLRPAGWPATYAALAVLTIAPIIWLGPDYTGALLLLAASTFLLLPRAYGVAVLAGTLTYSLVNARYEGMSAAAEVQYVFYLVVTVIGFGVAIPIATVLVRVLAQASRSRADMAARAVEVERNRVARDLHDLVGQSLAAVSLKGDLALQLLPVRPDAALAEVAGLTDVARGALHDVRQLTLRRPTPELQAELDGAAALLSAAGVHTTSSRIPTGLSRPVQELFAWAVREGTTNLLKHSDATSVTITFHRGGGRVELELRNDGARPPQGAGTGLAGLRQRAEALQGSSSAQRRGRDWMLTVSVPETRP